MYSLYIRSLTTASLSMALAKERNSRNQYKHISMHELMDINNRFLKMEYIATIKMKSLGISSSILFSRFVSLSGLSYALSIL